MEGVGMLKDMFSDMDEEIIRSVLAEANGNVDRAIDSLLTLSSLGAENTHDGNSNSTSANNTTSPAAQQLSQLELDELLAQELAQSDYSGVGFGSVGNSEPVGFYKPPSMYVEHSVSIDSLDSSVVQELMSSVKGNVIPIMVQQLKQMTVPAIKEQIEAGKLGSIIIGTDEIKVEDAVVPQESIEILVDKTKIKIRAKDISAQLQRFKWTYEKLSFPKMKDNGNADASISDTKISVDMSITLDDTGSPSLLITGCEVEIGKLDMKISGSLASFLYNTLLAVFKKTIKSTLEQSLSKMIAESVNNNGGGSLEFF